ncbi:MAG TPA: adenylyl-sulfate kinase [Candidatus Angelobacter sp.]
MSSSVSYHPSRDLLRLLTAGSVDDGKSTLIGRLLHDSGALPEDELAAVYKASRERGHEFDPSLVTDGLRAEREQGITIDVAYRYFATAKRKFIIADTPGHEQYTRNMVTGASTADLAVLLIDARKGVLTQTRRHLYTAWMLGIRNIVLALNKMDLVNFDQEVFERVKSSFLDYAGPLRFRDLQFVPMSALEGDNVTRTSERTPWYGGMPLLNILETVPTREEQAAGNLRFPVQLVIRPSQDVRVYAGQVASGTIVPGMEVMALPSRQRTRVERVFLHTAELQEAYSPMSVAVSLRDHIDLGRGDMLCDTLTEPPESHSFRAKLFWMSPAPAALHGAYLLKHATQTVCMNISHLHHKLDINTLQELPAASLSLNEIGEVTVQTHKPIFCDPYHVNKITGSFIVVDPIQNSTVAVGIITGEERPAANHGHPSLAESVSSAASHKGLTVWMTGLSGAGKTTICQAVYTEMLARGIRVEMLDGDTVRQNFSRNLGFSKEDRTENVRRIGYVAGLLTRNRVVTLVSAISPYRAARDEVRAQIGRFLEVYVNAPFQVCEQRDPKGLYRRARNGEIRGFTGLDDPYEPPLVPEIECRTDQESVKDSVDKVVTAILGAIE